MEPILITIQVETLKDRDTANLLNTALYAFLDDVLTDEGIDPKDWTMNMVYQNEVDDESDKEKPTSEQAEYHRPNWLSSGRHG